jgi:hypothetical protein
MARVARFFLAQHTKAGKILKPHKIMPKDHKSIPNDNKIFQMAIKSTNIFHSEAFQNA